MRTATSFLFLLLTLTACSSAPVRKKHTPFQESAAEIKPSALNKAQNFYQKGNYAGVKKTLDSIALDELSTQSRAEFWNLKGLVDLHDKNYDSAIPLFRRALEENQKPEDRGYYQFNLAAALMGNQKPRESYDILNAIDLGSIDSDQQQKVLSLKEKASKALAMTKTVTTTTTISGSKDATQKGIGPVIITSPETVFNGPASRKKIGLLVPLSGKYENFGKKVKRSVELAFQNSNDSNMKEVEIIAEDSGDSAATQLLALQKLVEGHQVIGVIGPVISKGIDTLAAKAVYYQVPLITLAQIQEPLATHLFFCSISIKDQISQTVDYAMNVKGYQKFAILGPSNKPGEETLKTFRDEVLSRQGEIVHEALYDPSSMDFRAPVDKVLGLDHPEKRPDEMKALAEKRKELNITRKTTRTAQYFDLPPIVDFDAVFIADEAKIAGQIIPTFTYRDAKDLKYLGISSWNSSQLIQRAQEKAEDAVFPVAFNTIDASEETKSFFDLYTANYNSAPGELDAVAFDAASIIIQALRKAPSSRDEFRTILETIGTVQGATGEVTIEDRKCSRNLALVEVQNGKFVIVKEK